LIRRDHWCYSASDENTGDWRSSAPPLFWPVGRGASARKRQNTGPRRYRVAKAFPWTGPVIE